jgi:hypothetical protein
MKSFPRYPAVSAAGRFIIPLFLKKGEERLLKEDFVAAGFTGCPTIVILNLFQDLS